MTFEKRHVIRHEEWEEAHFSPKEFFEIAHLFQGDDRDIEGRFSAHPAAPKPSFVFDNRTVVGDESWWFDGGKIETSSHKNGLVNWSEDEQVYILMFHGSRIELGQLRRVECKLNHWLAARLSGEVVPGTETQELEFTYINYRGEKSVRRVTPSNIWFGSTEFHAAPQWLLTAFDHDRELERDFALCDCIFTGRATQ